MDLGDIIFRGALILAVVMLAGVFAYNLGLDDKNDNEELSKIADSLSEMLYTISTWEDGSSAVIRFGDTGSGPMSLPGDINNEPFSVEVLPGMVVLVSGGRSEVSMEDISIVPSCPPEGPGTLNRSVTRMIGTTSG
ncbi:MAG: hypothetical protein U9R75_12510, partial [Candidatus Thermoplasmatota archaeon]|nr:hypothetical protein [Candidatus Thermoplasmatota archaeon]